MSIPKPLRDIVELPLDRCPLCENVNLTVAAGKKKLFGLIKRPDEIKCQACGALFLSTPDATVVDFSHIPAPYSFFGENFEGWMRVDKITYLAKLIREDSPEALSYLSGFRHYIWRVKLILGATGPVTKGGVSLNVEFETPETEKEAKQTLARIHQLQKEIRQVKREMRQEMKEIRAQYGRKKEVQAVKRAALAPYERAEITIDDLLVQMDGVKLGIQTWIDEQE